MTARIEPADVAAVVARLDEIVADPLPLSASADAPRDPDNAAITAPVVLPPEVRAYVVGQPDALLLSWIDLSPQAVEVLTVRERDHAHRLRSRHAELYSAEHRTGEAAAYVRERLLRGDHVQAAARLALRPGAVLTLNRRLYTVVERRGRTYRLRGPAGGRVDLSPPVIEGGCWSVWHGGVAARNAKLVRYRRQPDGAFVLEAAELERRAIGAAGGWR